jgi:hypothetical protein
MAKRKTLKGIASGLAYGFASRNNDYDGYWTLGILYAVASDSGTNRVSIDLATGKSTPEFKYSGLIAAPYYAWLLRQIYTLGFMHQVVKEAVITVEFNVPFPKKQPCSESGQGSPFICRATLVDDLQRVWSVECEGRCRPHDARSEARSTRRFPTGTENFR